MRLLSGRLLPVVATLAAIYLIWGTSLPLGAPGEWEWSRHDQAHPAWLTFTPLAITAGCYFVFVWLGLRRLPRSGPWECGLWLLGLAIAGFIWLWQAQEAAPNGYQLSKTAWVLYFPGPSGYFTEARGDQRPVGEFLRTYQQRMGQGDVLHIGTHPPGLILLFRGMLSACRESPALTRALLDTQPESVQTSLNELARTGGAGFTDVDRAVLWLAALGAQVFAALTVLPLFGLLRQQSDREISWMAAAFWPAVPAVAIFLPKSDAMFPFLATLILWLWVSGLARRSWLRMLLAGGAFWCGMVLTLAFLPIAAIAGLHGAWTVWKRPADSASGPNVRTLVTGVISVALGFILPTLLLSIIGGMNLLAVWRLNFQNHAGFYDQFTRTWWKWFLLNPLELTIAAGVPLVIMAIDAIWKGRKHLLRREDAAAFAWLSVWGLLWFSGKNMGEAARLWIFLIPGLIWIGADGLHAAPDATRNATSIDLRRAWFLLALQFLLSASLVTRVVGFHYS